MASRQMHPFTALKETYFAFSCMTSPSRFSHYCISKELESWNYLKYKSKQNQPYEFDLYKSNMFRIIDWSCGIFSSSHSSWFLYEETKFGPDGNGFVEFAWGDDHCFNIDPIVDNKVSSVKYAGQSRGLQLNAYLTVSVTQFNALRFFIRHSVDGVIQEKSLGHSECAKVHAEKS